MAAKGAPPSLLLEGRLPKVPEGIALLNAAGFFRDVWTPPPGLLEAMIRRREEDRAGFDAELEDADKTHDWRRLTAALEALERAGELSQEQAGRLLNARFMLQDWEGALRLLGDPRFARTKRADYWFNLASARAAVRPLGEAAEAAHRAVALDPKTPAMRDLAAAIDRLSDLEPRAGALVEWSAMEEHVGLLIRLHRFGRAAEVLSGFLERVGQASSIKKLDLGLRLARTLFRELDPSATQALFRRLRPAFALCGVGEAHDWAAQALARPEDPIWSPPPSFGDNPYLQVCVAQAFSAHGRWKTGAALFGDVATLRKDPYDARLELARCVGRALIEEIRPAFPPASGPRKVVDVFRFQDELMLLKLKLQEMAPWVDRFVILEANLTFTGRPKEQLFERHKHEFAPWADKIVHLTVEFPPWTDSPWAREFYQRDMALKVLNGYCSADDIVLVSDADELVRRSSIETFTGHFTALGMEVFKYFFNLHRRNAIQPCYASAWRAGFLEAVGLSTARLAPSAYAKWHVVPDAGWHFTSIKDPQRLVTKLQAYSHTEYAAALDADALALQLEGVRRGEPLEDHERWEIDERLPQVIRDNAAALDEFII